MKLLVMAHRADETAFFEKENIKYGYEIHYEPLGLSIDTVDLTVGYEAIAINAACKVDKMIAGALKRMGVKYILSRTAGVDHMDLEALHSYGIACANVPAYAPNAISEHTVMLLLMLLRKMKLQMRRMQEQYFLINGLRGRQLSSLTVGVIGTGRIGASTIANLKGFGCKILAYDLYENERIKESAEYATLDVLLEKSDAIVLHCPLTQENHHLINAEQIAKMKDGAILVNTARGGLVDTQAVYDALQIGKLFAFGMDVYEREGDTQRKDYREKELDDPLLAKLLSMDQVIYTTHTAFYTDDAIESIIATSLENLHEFEISGSCRNEK